jgi:hypothetical protein
LKCIPVLLVLMLPTSAPAQFAPSLGPAPDPLVLQDGQPVDSEARWQERRREMKDLVMAQEYGSVPDAPGNVTLDSILETGKRFEGMSEFQSLRIRFGPEKTLSTTVHCYRPSGISAPLPVILRFGLGGEHAPAANRRGYAFVCFEQTALDPDTEGYDEPGPAQAAYPEYDWGSLAVWAWCASRVMDYVETLPDIDVGKAVITGHSRTGKAALLAGALDERFALVVPNGSGAGGAALFRHKPKGIETLELITQEKRFRSWFQTDFGRFADREQALPFDQHFLRALVAPRVVLSTDAYGDQWANPEGTQCAWAAAQPVFDWIGVPGHNLIHMREGNHDQLDEDFAVLLDVADWLFRGAPPRDSWRNPPFPRGKIPADQP